MSGHSTVERGVRIRERVFSSWEELEWKQQGVGMQKAQGRGGWHCGGDWRPSGPCLSFYRCHHSQGRLIAELGLRPVPCLQIPKPPSLSLPHHLCGGPTNMPQWERGKNEDKGLEAWHLALPQSFLVASVSHFPTPHRSFVSSSYKKKKKKVPKLPPNYSVIRLLGFFWLESPLQLLGVLPARTQERGRILTCMPLALCCLDATKEGVRRRKWGQRLPKAVPGALPLHGGVLPQGPEGPSCQGLAWRHGGTTVSSRGV